MTTIETHIHTPSDPNILPTLDASLIEEEYRLWRRKHIFHCIPSCSLTTNSFLWNYFDNPLGEFWQVTQEIIDLFPKHIQIAHRGQWWVQCEEECRISSVNPPNEISKAFFKSLEEGEVRIINQEKS